MVGFALFPSCLISCVSETADSSSSTNAITATRRFLPSGNPTWRPSAFDDFAMTSWSSGISPCDFFVIFRWVPGCPLLFICHGNFPHDITIRGPTGHGDVARYRLENWKSVALWLVLEGSTSTSVHSVMGGSIVMGVAQ